MKDENGQYVVTRLMKYTNTELVGRGDTVEQARAMLREEVGKYRAGLRGNDPEVIQPTGGKFASPGMMSFRNTDGRIGLKIDKDRMGAVWARSAIVKMRRKEEK